MSETLTLKPGSVTLVELRKIWLGAAVSLSTDAYDAIDASATSVANIVASGETVYGVNTGFGLLANTSIPPDRLAELQRNLVMSHACGMGEDLAPHITRLAIALKVVGLARGYSGVRREVVDTLLKCLELDLIPCVPEQGSVGASGDLAPLAHIVAALMGEGRISLSGEIMSASDALNKAGAAPLTLGPKEGLALLNGTQISTAIALDALFTGERAFGAALMAGALSVEALMGSFTPFDARIHDLRGQAGQIDVAAKLRDLLEGSAINASHVDCEKVQDPYSFRCQPQVMGAALDLMRNVAATLTIEANAVTDNPIVFPETDEALSGGNFHAEPVAFAADMLAMALCEVGSISERRLAVLVDPHMSGLPAFLTPDGGANSGFMIPQVTAAALVSENKTLAHPASVDSIPTSAGQEDHVSMATHGARKAGMIARNVASVIGIELLGSVQAIEFHRPLKTTDQLETVIAHIRSLVPRLEQDRYMADDMAVARNEILAGRVGTGSIL